MSKRTSASEADTETPPAGAAEQAPAVEDKPRSIALRHPTTRQTVRCLPDEANEWAEKGYEPVPHSGGHGNPPDPS